MLAYRETGRGPAVVLLHGFPLAHTIWDRQVAHLSDRYRVIAPDLPGHGGSPPLVADGAATMSEMARAVLGLMDALGLERSAVAGHSMGGYVTLALHKQAPERVAGIGLVCSHPWADTPEARKRRFTLADEARQEGSGAVAAAMAPRLFGPAVTPDSPLYQSVMAVMRRTSVAGVRAALLGMAEREDASGRLAEIAVPALVVAGEHDPLITAERAAEMAAALPHCLLVKVPGAGHMAMLEQPEAVNRALDAWLERVY